MGSASGEGLHLGGLHPGGWADLPGILWDTVNEWVVRILLRRCKRKMFQRMRTLFSAILEKLFSKNEVFCGYLRSLL